MKYDNNDTQIFEENKENLNEKEYQTKLILSDTRCGIGCFSPKWLQILASKKAFVLVYAFAGIQTFMVSTYYIGTMSTIEKNFNMSSKMTGIISATWDGGSLLANMVVTYIATKGHRTRWISLGMFIVSISCFMRALPFHIYGGGETVKLYTKEYETLFNSTNHSKSNFTNTTGITYLSTNVNCDQSDTSFPEMVAFYTFFTAQFLTGLGCSVYYALGMVYMDDNARKNIVPVLLAFSQAIKLFGPTIGFLLSSYALKIYIDPTLTPTISNQDPKWIGAWWLGWYPLGIFGLMCAFALMLFPRILPRAAMRKIEDPSFQKNDPLSISDFIRVLKRVCKNKIVVFNSLSSVSFALGFMAFWTFMPKYMESQFRLTPSQSNFLTGTVGIISNGLGIMVAGLVISKLKPPPRFLAGWNVFVEFIDVLGRFAYIFLSCTDQSYHGHWSQNDNSWNLTETCNEKFNCGTDIQYSPVCDSSRDLVFYSPCHAGCTSSSIINKTRVYSNCTCVPDVDTTIINGICPVDCSTNIILLIVMMSVLGFTSATGRSANTLIQFRCVEERDKSMSISVTETLLAVFAFMPAPIFYGIIMDWTCMVWADNCGSKGNCWIYDNKKLRLGFNLTSAGFLFLGTILDCFVWYYVKGLKIYDEDFLSDSKKAKTANQALTEKFDNDKKLENDTELSLMLTKDD